MSLDPLELAWSLPEAWFLVPLDGDLDDAVETALAERTGRDARAAAAAPELEDLLRGHAEAERAAGAVAALVRWGTGPLGELVAAYAGLDRFERDDQPVEDEIEAMAQELLAERPDERAAPLVERVGAHLGPGLKRLAVQEAPMGDGGSGGGTELAQLVLVVELFVWVEGRRDLLRLAATSFQVGHAATIVEELEHIVGSLEQAPS